MLGAFSHAPRSEKRFRYTTAADPRQMYWFKLIFAGPNVAALQFDASGAFTEHIPPPPGFVLMDCTYGQSVVPFQDTLFINWSDSYVLQHNDREIFAVENPKQQTTRRLGDALVEAVA